MINKSTGGGVEGGIRRADMDTTDTPRVETVGFFDSGEKLAGDNKTSVERVTFGEGEEQTIRTAVGKYEGRLASKGVLKKIRDYLNGVLRGNPASGELTKWTSATWHYGEKSLDGRVPCLYWLGGRFHVDSLEAGFRWDSGSDRVVLLK